MVTVQTKLGRCLAYSGTIRPAILLSSLLLFLFEGYKDDKGCSMSKEWVILMFVILEILMQTPSCTLLAYA